MKLFLYVSQAYDVVALMATNKEQAREILDDLVREGKITDTNYELKDMTRTQVVQVGDWCSC